MTRKTYKDFLFDEEFISWMLCSDEERKGYKEKYLSDNPQEREAFETAERKAGKIRLNKIAIPPAKKTVLYNRIVASGNRKLRFRKTIKYFSLAASFILIAGAAFFAGNSILESHRHTVTGEARPPEDIRIISGNKVLDLSSNAHIELTRSGKAVITEEETEEKHDIQLSSQTLSNIIVPFGKQATVVLSDGTKVWLNSGTTLIFPPQFPVRERKVTLLGEAYLEVTHDSRKPFIVSTEQFDVKVLGTSFNVSAYESDYENNVVLVEGSVDVATRTEISATLFPAEMFVIGEGYVDKRQTDVSEHISWKDGYFIFNKTSYGELLDKVGRYYNLGFDIPESVAGQTCSGKLLLSEELDDVMKAVSSLISMQYKRDGRNIYFTPR